MSISWSNTNYGRANQKLVLKEQSYGCLFCSWLEGDEKVGESVDGGEGWPADGVRDGGA